MLYISFMFMGNLRFSYMQDRDFIVNEGYLPLLEMLRKYPDVRSDICLSGYTTLGLKEKYPEVIAGIKKGLADGRTSISTNGFEHVFLPTLSIFAQEKLIAKGVALDKDVYGRQPAGFWPSDCCWDSTVIKPLVDNGVKWAFVGRGMFAKSNPGGVYYKNYRDYDVFSPVMIQGPEGASIAGIHNNYGNYEILLESNAQQYEKELTMLKQRAAGGQDGFWLFGFDLEVLAVLKSAQWKDKKSKPFGVFVEDLLSLPGAQFCFVSDFLEKHPLRATVCLREGMHWGKGGWNNGCLKLDTTCRQAEAYLLEIEDLLATRPDRTKERQQLEKLWEQFFFAMTSEPRMVNQRHMWEDATNKCLDGVVIYPPDNMVLEAINNAISVLKEARQLRRQFSTT